MKTYNGYERLNRNYTLMSDEYEFTMANGYLNNHKENEEAVFDIFFRKVPNNGGYAVMAGIDKIIPYIQNLKFGEQELDYFRRKGYPEEFITYLKNFKFHGSIYAIPDGTPVFANEPIVTVKAPLIEAQIIETILLSYVNAGICYTTAAKRVTEAAGEIPIMEFGARRALGPDTAVMASTYSIIGGCVATSNVLAGEENNIPISGTFAHSFVTSFDTEYDAFVAYADTYPDNCILLVDTFDVLKSGVPNAIKTSRYLREKGHELKGIRIDSGDLAYLSKEAKKMFDKAGYPDVKICISNGLKEHTIHSLKAQGAVINSIGLGDNIVLPDQARVGCVYKQVALKSEGKYTAKIKASNDEAKAITPGYKKVYRFYDKETGFALGDVIALHDEKIPTDTYTLVDPLNEENKTTLTNYNVRPLQETIFKDGELVYEDPSIMEKKEYCTKQMETLYPEVKREENPHGYYVDLSLELLDLKKRMLRAAKEQKVEYDK
jgi:nicotinate phosphoribosyltransferase